MADAKLQAEVAYLKLRLNLAQKHLKKLKKLNQDRKQAYLKLRDDIIHFCQQWLDCLNLLDGSLKSRARAKELWFEFCAEVFPKSEDELKEKTKTSQLFINGDVPEFNHNEDPPEKI